MNNNKNIKNLFLKRFFGPYISIIILATFSIIFSSTITISMGFLLKSFVDYDLTSEQYSKNLIYAIISVFIFSSLVFSRIYLLNIIGTKVVKDMRDSVFHKLSSLSQQFFEESKIASIVSSIVSDGETIQNFINSNLPISLRSTITLLGGILMIIITSPKLSAYSIISLFFIIPVVTYLIKKSKKYTIESMTNNSTIANHTQETLSNIRTVQAFTQIDHENKVFQFNSKSYLKSYMLRAKTRGILASTIISSSFIIIIMLIHLGINEIHKGSITHGDLVSFIFYGFLITSSLNNLSDTYSQFQNAIAAFTRLSDTLLIKDDVLDKSTYNNNLPQEIPSSSYTLEFQNVAFHYKGQKLNISLQDFSLNIKNGEKIGIVGRSGAGKSTIFDLLLRFYDVKKGKILIGNHAIKSLPIKQLRKLFGVVEQNPTIFSSSIRENILYGNLDASEEEMIKAAENAHCLEFINDLPNKFDTYVGENGIKLSGGQKQRIAIARIMLKNPPILLLDEATSALDSRSEQLIKDSLELFMKNRTTLVIAHRLSTILNMDRIIVMDKGKLVDIGTHEELINHEGIYKDLAKLQFTDI